MVDFAWMCGPPPHSTVELGSNPGIFFIKRHDIPLDIKFPKHFDGKYVVTLNLLSKISYSAFFEIFHYLKKNLKKS